MHTGRAYELLWALCYSTQTHMGHIAIQIPQIPGEQEIEIDVKINGIRQQYNYRVEIFYWKDCEKPGDSRAECIRGILARYDKNWELYYIGAPTREYVPLTFRKKRIVELPEN